MSFADGLGRLISGKPVFEPSNGGLHNSQAPTPSDGPKYIPTVCIERIECYGQVDETSINVHIKNRSNVDIFVDKINLFGKYKEIDTTLRAGEMREFANVYRGAKPKDRNYKYCELDYKTLAGDYFRTMHTIEYEQEPDGRYTIYNIKFVPPARDINGNS